MRYLVDTDWVIHYLNGENSIRERLDEVRDEGVAVSIVTLAEVYEGYRNRRMRLPRSWRSLVS